ncbi:MAG: ATP-dependent ligase [Actinomycetia bacterium]|nr:ATP-dependent ligase [Actinomycetes bacterium]
MRSSHPENDGYRPVGSSTGCPVPALGYKRGMATKKAATGAATKKPAKKAVAEKAVAKKTVTKKAPTKAATARKETAPKVAAKALAASKTDTSGATTKAPTKKSPTKTGAPKKTAGRKTTPETAANGRLATRPAARTDGSDRLGTYRRKRDFEKTPEPAGVVADAPADAPRFVVQRHRARRLHYDFRLEMGGVLVSWAVPKGLTLDPGVRHLAVHVEDHPLDYIDFEGVIPKGEYGGGDVIVWDRGTWKLDKYDDPLDAVARGDLHIELNGEKLKGRFVLVRSNGGSESSGQDQWLVLHKRDDASVDGWDPEAHPASVLSGRTNDAVAANPDRKWTRAGEETLTRAVPTFPGPTPEELDQLDSLPNKGTWELQGRELALTNLDKVLFPPRDDGEPVTKRELIRYYASIAPTMLPYLFDRPLNLHRYPNGAGSQGFWQKQAPAHTPEWVRLWHREDADEGESEDYIVADSAPTLAWLANQAALELHAWTSTIADPQKPTYALIDLDPGTDTTWEQLLTLARLHRVALEQLGVRGYPKVSGQRGIQIWVPIEPGPSFDETRAWVETLSRTVGRVVGDLVSWNWGKSDRGGKARLDYTQNAINKTLVAPYSVRPAAGAPVSAPIEWDELEEPELRPDRWTIRTVGDRLADKGDLMLAMLTDRQSLRPLS